MVLHPCNDASMVLLLAPYQVLCYCSLAKPDPHTLVSFTRLIWDCLHAWTKCDGRYKCSISVFHFGLHLWPRPQDTPRFYLTAVEKIGRRPGIIATSRTGNGGLG